MIMGRPSKYSEELTDRICQMISTSNKGLYKLCQENDDLPNADTIYLWLTKYPEFSDKYARAREIQAELLADEIIEIADETSHDTLTTDEGKEYENKEWVNRSKLRVDARKWKASKLAPKKYGDKLDVTTDGDKINSIDLTKVDSATLKKLLDASDNNKGAD